MSGAEAAVAGAVWPSSPVIVGWRRRTRRPDADVIELGGCLAEHPVAGDCSRRELDWMWSVGDAVSVVGGRVVQPRLALRWVYFVLTGALAVESDARVDMVAAGCTVGLRSALVRESPVLSVSAVADSNLFVMTAEQFRALVRRSNALGCGVSRYLARQLEIA